MSTLNVVLLVIVALSSSASSSSVIKPQGPAQVPHYVDGEHNDEFVEHRESLAAHSCSALLDLYGSSYGRRAAIIPPSEELDRLAISLKSTVCGTARDDASKSIHIFFFFFFCSWMLCNGQHIAM
jgi:hypothetical protein